jgi:hypothetical protein
MDVPTPPVTSPFEAASTLARVLAISARSICGVPDTAAHMCEHTTALNTLKAYFDFIKD